MNKSPTRNLLGRKPYSHQQNYQIQNAYRQVDDLYVDDVNLIPLLSFKIEVHAIIITFVLLDPRCFKCIMNIS